MLEIRENRRRLDQYFVKASLLFLSGEKIQTKDWKKERVTKIP